jgi:hypothetical protein
MISANGVVFAQNLNLKFYSSLEDGDFKSDFSGVAVAIYLNDAELQVIQTKISSMGRDLDKLTKNNSWLCWKALHEWEIQNGETYFVMCAASMYSQDGGADIFLDLFMPPTLRLHDIQSDSFHQVRA